MVPELLYHCDGHNPAAAAMPSWCVDGGLTPTRGLQVALQLPSGATFISSTPEQLYVRRGQAVASEAVAGTRPRGPAGEHAHVMVNLVHAWPKLGK